MIVTKKMLDQMHLKVRKSQKKNYGVIRKTIEKETNLKLDQFQVENQVQINM